MTRFRLLIVLALGAGLGALLMVAAVERRLGSAALAVGAHPDVMAALDAGLEDQRRLAELDPTGRVDYRTRFERIERLRARLLVFDLNRDRIVRRAQLTLVLVVGALGLVGGSLWWLGERRTEQRLESLGAALAALARGDGTVSVADRRRDTLGRVARLVEASSRAIVRERRRSAALAHLAEWQEAARRQAHEIRTPLAAASLELGRLRDLVAELPREVGEEGRRLVASLGEEHHRLERFTRELAGLARLPPPRRELQLVAPLLDELVATFAGAWPGVSLERGNDPDAEGAWAALDPELLRQALVNLIDNAARALGPTGGGVVRLELNVPAGGTDLAITVSDNGPGLPEKVRLRLFTPYTTTQKAGSGLGLGLAIAKKIALDHEGDLELVDSGPHGTIFRLCMPRSEAGKLAPSASSERAVATSRSSAVGVSAATRGAGVASGSSGL